VSDWEHHERVVLDSRIFSIEIGREAMSWKRYKALKAKAEQLMRAEAQALADLNGCTFDLQFKQLQKIRHRDRMEAMLSQHLELFPDDKELEPLAAQLRLAKTGKDIDPEVLRQFRKKFDYLHVKRPVPPISAAQRIKRALSDGFNCLVGATQKLQQPA